MRVKRTETGWAAWIEELGEWLPLPLTTAATWEDVVRQYPDAKGGES